MTMNTFRKSAPWLVTLAFLILAVFAHTQTAFLYPVTQPYKLFTNTSGTPLQNGKIYFGVANQNPETNPITMYWDVGGTIPAAQPIRTVNGYIARGGAPANIFAVGDFSITVRDAQDRLIFHNPVSADIQLAASILSGTTSAGAIGIADAGNYYTGTNVESALQQLGPLLTQMVTALAGTVPTGTMTDYVGGVTPLSPPSGWVIADGKTIGGPGSGATATGGLGSQTQALFVLLYQNYTTNTLLQLQDLNGNPVARSGSGASADYAASRRLCLPDMRGRVRVGRDSSVVPPGGGAATLANRITSGGAGIDTAIMGNNGGAQTHTLTAGQLASHTHTVSDPGHEHTLSGTTHQHPLIQGGVLNGTGGTINVILRAGSAGGTSNTENAALPVGARAATGPTGLSVTPQPTPFGQAHNNVQPIIVNTVIIKL